MGTVGKLGRYTVLRRLSSGGMGEVFVARQEGLAGFEKLVVIKTLRPDLAERQHFRDMFFEEARMSALARHANVVSVLDVGIDKGIYYLVMEYIEGWSVRQLLEACAESGKPLPLPHVLTIAIDLASGLDHIHALRDAAGNPLKLVHRDVSPENVMITVDGLSKLVDFGIAKRHDSPIITEPGVLKGKARYLAPEQVRGGAISPATDQFALASVIFEMCTGEPLFPGKTTVEIMFALGRGTIREAQALREDLPDELTALLDRALARDPEDRLASCGEVADELVRIQTVCEIRETRADLVGFLNSQLEPPSRKVQAAIERERPRVAASTEVTVVVDSEVQRATADLPRPGSRDSGDLPTGMLGRPRRPHALSDSREISTDTQIGRLIGRTAEIDAIRTLFDSGVKLVTLLGPGGVGKTSLARHHAYVQRTRASDQEIYFCDLSESRTLDEFAYAVAESLSVPLGDELSWDDAVVHIGDALAAHSAILFILDNLEQVIEPAASALSRWLDLASSARFWLHRERR